MCGMKSIKDIRRANLQQCVDEAGSPKNFLAKYGHLYGADGKLSASYLSQLLSGTTTIGNGAAQKFAVALGKPNNWFDVDRSENVETTVAKPNSQWPFSVSLDAFLEMPPEEQRRMDEYLEYYVNKWHSSNPIKSRKAS